MRHAGWTNVKIAYELGTDETSIRRFFTDEKSPILTESDLRAAAERLPAGVSIATWGGHPDGVWSHSRQYDDYTHGA